MASIPDQRLIEELQQYCQDKPRTSIKRFSSGNRFHYNRLGFLLDFAYLDLSSFARFDLDETTALMTLRCSTHDFETLQGQHPNIRTHISKSKKRDPVGWQWVDIALEGSTDKALLHKLINQSYELLVGAQDDFHKFLRELAQPPFVFDDVLQALIQHNDLSHRSIDIARLPQPSIRLVTQPVSEAFLPVGWSKIGGVPDLPTEWDWPTYKHKPLAFLAQINLSQIPQAIDKNPLPDIGILYFFSVHGWLQDDGDVHPDLPWEDSEHPDFSRVLLFTGNNSDLRRRQKPVGIKTFKAASVEYVPFLTLPRTSDYCRDPAVAHLPWTEGEFERFVDLFFILDHVSRADLAHGMYHQLLGYSSPIQSQVVQLGQRLLCQIESDYDHTEMMWGDGGTIYFVIDAEALNRLDFSEVTTDFQCG